MRTIQPRTTPDWGCSYLQPVAKYRHAIEPELLLLSVYFVFVLWSEIRGLAHRKAQLLTR